MATRPTAHSLFLRKRRSSWRTIREAGAFSLLSAPLIYSLVFPLAVLDAWIRIYEAVCFPVYGIAKVPRRRYFIFDRGRLPYLNAVERLGCLYCSYANGVISYAREAAARTEQYFCPIKHGRLPQSPHGRYRHFAGYGDEAGFYAARPWLRAALRPFAAAQNDNTQAEVLRRKRP